MHAAHKRFCYNADMNLTGDGDPGHSNTPNERRKSSFHSFQTRKHINSSVIERWTTNQDASIINPEYANKQL